MVSFYCFLNDDEKFIQGLRFMNLQLGIEGKGFCVLQYVGTKSQQSRTRTPVAT